MRKVKPEGEDVLVKITEHFRIEPAPPQLPPPAPGKFVGFLVWTGMLLAVVLAGVILYSCATSDAFEFPEETCQDFAREKAGDYRRSDSGIEKMYLDYCLQNEEVILGR